MSAQIKDGGPADVLAVLDEFVVVVGDEFGNDPAVRLREVRDDVAELIEATKEFRAGIAALVICEERSAPQDICDAVAEKFQKAADRLDAAIARVGSAS